MSENTTADNAANDAANDAEHDAGATIDLTEAAPKAAQATTPLPRPRIRWAAIVWGTVFAALALAITWLSSDVQNRDAVSSWLQHTTPGVFVLLGALVLGAVLLISGLVAILRRAGRPRT